MTARIRQARAARDRLPSAVVEYFEHLYRVRRRELLITGRPTTPACLRFAGANASIPDDVRSVLDVGCGRGEFLDWLAGPYWKVGVDFSQEAIGEFGGLKVLATASHLPFDSAALDLVTCFEVLEHIQYNLFDATLRELSRVSRKYIIVSVPNREILGESLVWCPLCMCAFNASWHVRAFDERALAGLFEGFRMVECRGCGPVARYGGSRLAELAVQLARRRPPVGVQCPQCGYVEVECPPVEAPTPLAKGVRWLTKAVLMREARPYWLLALYVRSER